MNESTSVVTAQSLRRAKKKASRKKTLILTTMVLPTAIWLILLRYLPMFGILLSFKKFQIYTDAPGLINNFIHSEWVGFKNFEFLFTKDTLGMLRNTIGYNVLFICLGLCISVSFAIMLNEITNKFVAKVYQTLMFFPYFLSWVVASYFVMALLDPARGLIVHWQINTFGEATNWYYDTKPWPVILTICTMWKNMGYQTILYLAAVTGIDASQYEAASIDGATKWQQVKYVTIPHLRPMITILLIMDVGKIFNSDFGLFYQIPMNSGMLYSVTEVIDTYVYRALMITQNIGMSSAAGFLQNLVGFVLIMIANKIVTRIDEDSALF